MLEYIAKRIFLMVPVLIGISILVFLMRVVVPGDPVDIMLYGQPSTEENRAELRSFLGLDQPLPTQYFLFVGNALRGDLGRSIQTRQPVASEIKNRFPNTFKLTICSLIIAAFLGVFTGVLSAVKKDTWVDLASMVASLIGVSMPAFWLGLILMMVFSVNLGWFPVMGSETWKHLVLPSLTLGLIAAAIISRMTRSCMLDVLQKDYIKTARSKGLSERRVIYKHSLRNAMIPVITIIGLQFGYLLGGAVIVEIVFNYPGIGEAALNAINWRDFPMIQGLVLFITVIFVSINLAVDVIYSFLNPQISYD